MAQKSAVQRGEPVRIHDIDIDLDYVVVRADVFDRVQTMLALTDLDPQELYPAIDEQMADDDASDPLLESYQKYKAQQ